MLTITSKSWVGERKKTWPWTSLLTMIKPLSKAVVIKNDLAPLGLCWSFYDLNPLYSLPFSLNLVHFLYLYIPVRKS